MSNLIQVNTVIEWLNAEETDNNSFSRVLWISYDRKQVVLFLLTEDARFPTFSEMDEIDNAIVDGDALIRPVDPCAIPIMREEDIPEHYRNHRDKNWAYMEAVVKAEPDIFFPEKRGKFVSDAAAKGGTQKKYVYALLRRYWLRGKVKNAFLPDFDARGGRGIEKSVINEDKKRGRKSERAHNNQELKGINITEVHKETIKKSIEKYYNTSDENSLRRVHQLMLENHYSKGQKKIDGYKVKILAPTEECPTFEQFYYYYRKYRNVEKSLIARISERSFNLKKRAILNDSTHDANGPGHIFQIDSTIADVYLLSSNRKSIIGRPVLYFVVDVFSRMVVGLYIGLEGPSWMGAAMALANTAANKVKFCAENGLSIVLGQWPSETLCERLVADRAEMLSKNSDNLINNFGITVTNTPPYRADFKGIVEQQFRKANVSLIHWLPGRIKKRYRERGEKDHRLDATLTVKEFTKLVITMVIDFNNNQVLKDYPLLPEMIADGVSPVPTKLWSWGMKHRTGYLQYRTEQEIMLGLMPSRMAKITRKGIKLNGLHYSCERAIRESWFVVAGESGSFEYKAYYDPRKINKIFVVPDGEKEPIECSLLQKDERYSTDFLEDVLESRAMVRELKEGGENQERQGKATLEGIRNGIIEEAKKHNAAARDTEISNNKRVSSIRKDRSTEKEIQGDVEAFDPTRPNTAKAANVVQDPAYKTSEHAEPGPFVPTKSNKMLDMLKSQRKGGK